MDIKEKNKICSFICTHDKRSEFLDGFIFHYNRCNIGIKLFVFTNEKDRVSDNNIEYIIDDIDISHAFTSSDNNWGVRLKNSINFLKETGYEYVIFNPDDGWILNEILDKGRLEYVINNLKINNIDNYRLSQRIEHIDNKNINNDFELIHPHYLTHYLTHQTSIWNINSLCLITNNNDTSRMHESDGSNRCLTNGFKMFQYVNNPVLDSIGVNHCTVGFDKDKIEQSIKLNYNPYQNK